MNLKEADKIFIVNVVKSIISPEKIKFIFLFGSYAQGVATEKSDIDVAIDMGSPIPTYQWSLIEEQFEESDLLMKVDVVDFQRTSSSFKETIKSTGIKLKLW